MHNSRHICEHIYISIELRFNHYFSNVYWLVFFNIIGWIETNDVMVLNLRILIQKNYLTSFNYVYVRYLYLLVIKL